MSWISSYEDLYDFIALVVVSAPDRFPVEDYLSESEQLNLDRAFDEIIAALPMVSQRISDTNEMSNLREMLNRSFSAFVAGDDKEGVRFLQSFEQEIALRL